MPYKSQEEKRKHDRDYIKRRRGTTSSRDDTGGTTSKITEEGTFFIDGVEMVPPLGTLPARPRYLTLSDGQVLDRANLPKPTKQITVREAMSKAMANRADGRVIDQAKADRYKRWREDIRLEAFQDKKERERLQSICASLSEHNVLDKVYLGTRDPVPMSEVAELLTAFD